MYFYRIGTWESNETYDTIFMSSKLYSQKEFEEIVFKCYEEVCYKIIKDEPRSLCFDYFKVDYVVIFNDAFEKAAQKYDLYAIRGDNVVCEMFFDLSFGNRSTKYNHRLKNIVNNLDIDESCWEDCWRLDETYNTDRLKKRCIVGRKKRRC